MPKYIKPVVMVKNTHVAQFFDEIKDGQFMTIEFFKKETGEIRRMNCRKGVRKGVKGTGYQQPDHIRKVWDRSKQSFRSFDMNTLLTVTCKGHTVRANITEDTREV